MTLTVEHRPKTTERLASAPWPELAAPVSLVLLVLVFGALDSTFLSSGNIDAILQASAILVVLAVGQTFVVATAGAIVLSWLPILAVLAGLAVAAPALAGTDGIPDAVTTALLWLPARRPSSAFVVLAALVLVAVRLLALGLEVGHHPVHGRQAWQAWSMLRVLDEARTWLFPIYSSGLTPPWLRALGADIGSDVEASTVLMIPPFVRVGAGAFLADDTLVGGYELGGGWLRVEHVRVGKGAFVGNSGMAAPGRRCPRSPSSPCCPPPRSAARRRPGTSWLGSPPRPLRRERDDGDAGRTYAPPRRLRMARALVELCRIVPVWLHVLLVVLVAAALAALLDRGPGGAVLLGGPVLLVAGLRRRPDRGRKWLLVGRMRPPSTRCGARSSGATSSPTPSSRSSRRRGSPARPPAPPCSTSGCGRMGSRIGRGVWCETYWLPEADLIDLRAGATVGRGCVVQTHLFHDRILSMDRVTIADGGTLGPTR